MFLSYLITLAGLTVFLCLPVIGFIVASRLWPHHAFALAGALFGAVAAPFFTIPLPPVLH